MTHAASAWQAWVARLQPLVLLGGGGSRVPVPGHMAGGGRGESGRPLGDGRSPGDGAQCRPWAQTGSGGSGAPPQPRRQAASAGRGAPGLAVVKVVSFSPEEAPERRGRPGSADRDNAWGRVAKQRKRAAAVSTVAHGGRPGTGPLARGALMCPLRSGCWESPGGAAGVSPFSTRAQCTPACLIPEAAGPSPSRALPAPTPAATASGPARRAVGSSPGKPRPQSSKGERSSHRRGSSRGPHGPPQPCCPSPPGGRAAGPLP